MEEEIKILNNLDNLLRLYLILCQKSIDRNDYYDPDIPIRNLESIRNMEDRLIEYCVANEQILKRHLSSLDDVDGAITSKHIGWKNKHVTTMHRAVIKAVAKLQNKTQSETSTLQNDQEIWPAYSKIEGNKFIFDDNNWVQFDSNKSGVFKTFKMLFQAQGKWVSTTKVKSDEKVGDPKRTILHIISKQLRGNDHTKNIAIESRKSEQGLAERRIKYSPSPTA